MPESSNAPAMIKENKAIIEFILGWGERVEREMQILNVIHKVAGKPLEIDNEESLFESGLLDSFMLVDLIAGLEEKFGIKIPDSDLIPQKFDSISRISRYLDDRGSR
jgi:acyl carrier protein